MILSTGTAIEGHPVKEYLDIVTSQAIMGVHFGRDIKALGRSIVGWSIWHVRAGVRQGRTGGEAGTAGRGRGAPAP